MISSLASLGSFIVTSNTIGYAASTGVNSLDQQLDYLWDIFFPRKVALGWNVDVDSIWERLDQQYLDAWDKSIEHSKKRGKINPKDYPNFQWGDKRMKGYKRKIE